VTPITSKMETLPKHYHYLTLKLKRIQTFEEWRSEGNGLSFALVKGGRGCYGLGTATWKVTAGDVLVSNPDGKGKLTTQKGELLFWEFASRVEHLLPLFSAEEICMLQGILENFRGSRLYAASTPLAKKCHDLAESAPPPGSLDHRSHVLLIASAVLTLEFLNARNQRHATVPGQDHLHRAFEELSADELLTLSIEELAKKFCCSQRHLNRLFHQQFGCSVRELRMELRLLKAVSLLRNPSAKVIAVAEQCGFNHLGLFHTCFRRRFGQSPGQWRKTDAANAVDSALEAGVSPQPTYSASLHGSANMSAGVGSPRAKGLQIPRGIFSDGIRNRVSHQTSATVRT
jgi:AraC-like DNA-binding protein